MHGIAVVPILMAVVLVAAPALAQEKPVTPEQAADQVLATLEGKDRESLKAFADRSVPDPWLVADELCARGRFDAAEAFAKAAPRKDVERLPAYVAARRKRRTPASRRETLGTVREAVRAGKPAEALAALEGVAFGDDVASVRLAFLRGQALAAQEKPAAGAQALRAAAAMAERIGWLARAVTALHRAGEIASEGGKLDVALACWERRLEIEKARGSGPGIAQALVNVGSVRQDRNEYEGALRAYARAVEEGRASDSPKTVATALRNAGTVHAHLGNWSKALEVYEEALKINEQLQDRAAVAASLINIGGIHHRQGGFSKALTYYHRGLKEARAAGHLRWESNAISNIGAAYSQLGSLEKALEFQEKAVELKMKLKDFRNAANTLLGMGDSYRKLGKLSEAIERTQRALELSRKLDYRSGVAAALINLGNMYLARGDAEAALGHYEQGLAEARAIGQRAWEANALSNIAGIHAERGEYEQALERRREALRLAEDLGAQMTVAENLWGMGLVHLARNDYRSAVRVARDGVERVSLMTAGLGAARGAAGRDVWATLYEIGALAALNMNDPVEACYFLESARAGTLLESLEQRAALVRAAIPAGLLNEETAARRAEAEAVAAHRRATFGRNRKQIQEARRGVEDARARVRAAVDGIQREARAQADLFYPEAAPLESVRGLVGEGEALAVYGLAGEEALALVIAQEDARLVRLGPKKKIDEAHARLRLGDPEADSASGISALHDRVIRPLGLGKNVTRLLVAPIGALCYVPFAALLDHEVAYLPSGTTYGLLARERGDRGDGILALGDPNAGVDAGAGSLLRRHRAGKLTPLPGSAEEARALGTTVLLGRDATETGLTVAVRQRPRWRAIHFACHGVIEPEKPMHSSLALTGDERNDGFLTTLDVFRLEIPADLVVLSACETAKGKLYRAEGVVGFTRAFMYAGAPRVIVSLWKVDDDATRALMVKFYELWNPKDGPKGVPAATALRKAQEHVAGHEKWKHPYYWAAWQLWGLPD